MLLYIFLNYCHQMAMFIKFEEKTILLIPNIIKNCHI